jgi:hypothetical protein
MASPAIITQRDASLDKADDPYAAHAPPTLHAQQQPGIDAYASSSAASAPPATTVRPPIDYSSAGAFGRSVGARFRSIWTRRFALSLLAGQVVSLCITCTNVSTTELVSRNWSLPTTQTFFL